jgi:hypothetical protein
MNWTRDAVCKDCKELARDVARLVRAEEALERQMGDPSPEDLDVKGAQ